MKYEFRRRACTRDLSSTLWEFSHGTSLSFVYTDKSRDNTLTHSIVDFSVIARFQKLSHACVRQTPPPPPPSHALLCGLSEKMNSRDNTRSASMLFYCENIWAIARLELLSHDWGCSSGRKAGGNLAILRLY